MINVIKKITLAGGRIIMNPGDTLRLSYTGLYGKKFVKDKRIIEHKVDDHRSYTHVAIVETVDELGHDYGYGAILLGDN